MLHTLRSELAALGSIVRTLTVVAVAAALYRELRKPPEERTWHGQLVGVVPYDFRLPTIDRLRDAYFNSSTDRLFSPMPMGVGWAVNVAAVLKRLGLRDGRGRGRAGGRRAREG
jgi:hypothetical protein